MTRDDYAKASRAERALWLVSDQLRRRGHTVVSAHGPVDGLATITIERGSRMYAHHVSAGALNDALVPNSAIEGALMMLCRRVSAVWSPYDELAIDYVEPSLALVDIVDRAINNTFAKADA